MFQFFKRKGGKATHTDAASASALPASVSRARNDKTNEKRSLPKDVVNLLIPETDYTQKTGVSIFNIMAGRKRKGRKKARTESFRASPPRETHIERCESVEADVTADRNSPDARTETDPAEFVKALVLQKYAKTPAENKQHVSTVYVSNEPDLDEKRHTEALLREIARSIDCTVDQLNDKQMGAADSKTVREPVYQTIEENGSNSTIDSYKHDLKDELNRLTEAAKTVELESPNSIKKSNLKPPKSDTEGCSDDDRSDNGKKKVTFRKHIIFDDGEQQTDEENDSFESLSSEEEEFLEDIPLDENKTVIKVNEPIKIVEDRKIFSDSSDSGFLECDRNGSGDELTTVKSGLESESDSETEEEIIEIIEEEISGEEFEEVEEEVEEEEVEDNESTKSLVNHEEKFQSQVESRTEETERARELIAACRKEIEAKDQEIEQLKCDLASAYKESELIRQRSRSLEEDLNAARSCSASLADQLQRRNGEHGCNVPLGTVGAGPSAEPLSGGGPQARSCSATLADQLQRRNGEHGCNVPLGTVGADPSAEPLSGGGPQARSCSASLADQLQRRNGKHGCNVPLGTVGADPSAEPLSGGGPQARSCSASLADQLQRRNGKHGCNVPLGTVGAGPSAEPVSGGGPQARSCSASLADQLQRRNGKHGCNVPLGTVGAGPSAEPVSGGGPQARSCSASLADQLQRRNGEHGCNVPLGTVGAGPSAEPLSGGGPQARSCSASLADQLQRRNEECMRGLRVELEDAQTRIAELESRAEALERDKDRLEQEKKTSEQKALEALSAAEATTAKWRAAHESARSQAAARAERMLADCEWKTRELEQRARQAERSRDQLTEKVEKLEARAPTPAQVAELQQLRGLATEQQRSVQALTLQLQRLETREEALKLEVHRLKELLEREETRGREREHEHTQKVKYLEESHSKTVECLKSEHKSSLASTRAALAQLRTDSEQAARSADRKLREITNRYENLKEVLAAKESQFEMTITEARSKADWESMQLRHLLDKADIDYANKVDRLTSTYEAEKESLIEEWTEKLKEVEEQAAEDATNAQKLLESSRLKLMAEKLDQINKLKEQHRKEMDEQFEQFMTDKENCLERMKLECRQEGDEERVKREKELLEEIAELKSQVHLKSNDFDNLAVKAAACGRTLAVTEQELRDTLAREKELRERRSEDTTRIKQLERSCKDQVEHLTRKCACLRKLFDDIRTRLAAKERSAEQDARSKDKEIHHLRGEVARLTKLLVEQSSPKLGARTRADGCEMALQLDEKARKGM